MAAYINRNMTNNEINSDSSTNKQYLFSENNITTNPTTNTTTNTDDNEVKTNIPTGGYPPIFIALMQTIEKPIQNSKQRQFIKPQINFSIRDILSKDHKN